MSAGLIGAGKPDLTESEQADRKRDIGQTLTCLKEANAAGYDDFKHIRQDPDLHPLRELPEFQALFPKAELK